MLAGELAGAGVRVVVLEQRHVHTTASRASTLHARTMEILDARGLLPQFGTPPNEPRGHFGGIPLDLTLPSSHPGQWKVPQTKTEAVLEEWAIALGADIRCGYQVTDLTQQPDHITAHATTHTAPDTTSTTSTDGTGGSGGSGAGHGGLAVRARYLVACDGQDSTIRALTGADFPGQDAARELLRADVDGITVPDRRFQRLKDGLAIAARRGDGVTRVMVHAFGTPATPRTGTDTGADAGAEAGAGAGAGVSFAEITAAWRKVTGEDISGGTPLWVNSFGDASRLLTRYRHGRILFAGDAAHRQMPIGGQALNLGLQDAVNLGWKLAAVVRGHAGPGLLDTYHTERHAVGARVLSNIRAQALMLLGGPEVEPLRAVLAELITHEDVRTHLAGMISGLDIRYPITPAPGTEPHPLLGTRLPHALLHTADGLATTAALLRPGGGLLLDLRGGHDGLQCTGWQDRVTTVTARIQDTATTTGGPGGGPAGGPGGGPAGGPGGGPAGGLEGVAEALLVRPDGYVAWTGKGDEGLTQALTHWFGPPTP
nr:FAD-dependent monooxygenase [Actinacidiphila acididurans]